MNPADLKSNDGIRVGTGAPAAPSSTPSCDAAKEKRYQEFKASQSKAK